MQKNEEGDFKFKIKVKILEGRRKVKVDAAAAVL